MRWMRWFCLPLAFKFWHGDLLLDSPTHDQACTRRTYFLPRSFHSCSTAAVCLSPHTNVAQNVYFRAQGVGRRRRTFHISVYQAICVRLCKCASPDPSNSVDIWSPLQLWSVALSFTPVHVHGGRFWLPKHMMICELWHWNSSHIHTLTPLKVIVGFFSLATVGNEKEKKCALSCYCTTKAERLRPFHPYFYTALTFTVAFRGEPHTRAITNIDASFCNPVLALM